MPRTGGREAEHEDVEQFGAGSGTEGIDANAQRVAATLNQQTLRWFLHERPDGQEMADLPIFLEEWEWARQGVIEEASRA